MVHWRMETVSPSGLLSCAQSLVETILDIGIRTVWLATDYPYALAKGDHKVTKSSTFRDFGPAHKQAIASLIAHPDIEVVDLLGRMATTNVDMGVMGILDKLVGVDADVFLAGGVGCGRSSSFTKQIVQEREYRLLENEHMLNIVDTFTPHAHALHA
ncbi:hypothetical protein CYLTODRAFT_351952 [Cylindrobasidium torrendii FP15055 ss-10]|uniref:Uncharacterized protein n=1 Tax=Cylindrobasidium torrendii FP15055 ss-10 TaxID=1314674 RepID=A0A0D7BC14_9AGAR|nr:hypothetical protein CYLTODRAFT_351952 [Cylindrobasidium torrendii FP15055 ss-10]